MTTKELVKLTGVTPRMLQYWDEQGYIPVHIEVHSRTYTPEQVQLVSRLAVLRKAGVKFGAALRVAKRMKMTPDDLKSLVLEVHNIGLRLR